MSSAEQAKLSPDLKDFFFERLCQEADMVYRFALTLTLNRKASFDMSRQAYQKQTASLTDLIHDTTTVLRVKLFSTVWQGFHAAKDKFEVDAGVLGKFMGTLSIDKRSVLYLLDVAGLSAAEAAQVIGSDELQIRRLLADARRNLVSFVKGAQPKA